MTIGARTRAAAGRKAALLFANNAWPERDFGDHAPAERLGDEVIELGGRGLRAEDGREGGAGGQEIQLSGARRRGARHVRGDGDDIVPVQFARGGHAAEARDGQQHDPAAETRASLVHQAR